MTSWKKCWRPSGISIGLLAQLVYLQKSMKTDSKILFSGLLLLAACFSADAASRALQDFLARVAQSCVSFDYSYVHRANNTKVTGTGSLELQDNSFRMKGDGIEIWCDGKARWVLDRTAREAVIETVGASGEDYAVNPALLLAVVDEAFQEISYGTSKFGGRVVDVSILSPRRNREVASHIAQLKLYFKSGTSEFVGAGVKMADGAVTDFTIRNLSFSGKKEAPFRFDEKTLDDSYLITDLR